MNNIGILLGYDPFLSKKDEDEIADRFDGDTKLIKNLVDAL
jgi:hypothetical protein